jgi:hypothetical protein
LKLLTYFWADVLVAGIELAEMTLENVDLVEGKIALAYRLYAGCLPLLPSAPMSG